MVIKRETRKGPSGAYIVYAELDGENLHFDKVSVTITREGLTQFTLTKDGYNYSTGFLDENGHILIDDGHTYIHFIPNPERYGQTTPITFYDRKTLSEGRVKHIKSVESLIQELQIPSFEELEQNPGVQGVTFEEPVPSSDEDDEIAGR